MGDLDDLLEIERAMDVRGPTVRILSALQDVLTDMAGRPTQLAVPIKD